MTFQNETLNRTAMSARTGLSFATLGFAALGFATVLGAVALTATPASAAGAQYCIARGGTNGDAAYVGNCVYSDYQQCLQAAADSRGNCVANIEYQPGTSTAPAVSRTRRSR